MTIAIGTTHSRTIGRNHCRRLDRGAGLMFFHYCVEPGAETGRREMLDWIGGYFEINYSVNPTWEADFTSLPNHPIARGVPFPS